MNIKIKKNDIKTGDILQIPLPSSLGFAYAKNINLLDGSPNARYPNLLRVFNYRGTQPEKDFTRLVATDLLLCPILVAGIIPAISKGIWKVVGWLPVKPNELKIPHYKTARPNEERPKEWYYVVDADISKAVKSKYENVSHLETIGAVGCELVGTKIAMALLKAEGKKIENYFKLEEYYEKEFYREVTNIPLYYEMSDNLKGQAIVA